MSICGVPACAAMQMPLLSMPETSLPVLMVICTCSSSTKMDPPKSMKTLAWNESGRCLRMTAGWYRSGTVSVVRLSVQAAIQICTSQVQGSCASAALLTEHMMLLLQRGVCQCCLAGDQVECWFTGAWWEGLVQITRDDGVVVYFPGMGDTQPIYEDQDGVPEGDRTKLRWRNPLPTHCLLTTRKTFVSEVDIRRSHLGTYRQASPHDSGVLAALSDARRCCCSLVCQFITCTAIHGLCGALPNGWHCCMCAFCRTHWIWDHKTETWEKPARFCVEGSVNNRTGQERDLTSTLQSGSTARLPHVRRLCRRCCGGGPRPFQGCTPQQWRGGFCPHPFCSGCNMFRKRLDWS